MSREDRNKLIAVVAGLAAAMIVRTIGLQLVAQGVADRDAAGFEGAPQRRFVVVLVILCGVGTWWLVSRLLHGPKLQRSSFSLYRDKTLPVPALVELVGPLEKWGYRPIVIGNVLTLQGVRHGGLTLDLATLSSGYASLEIADTGNDRYTELANYTMYELGRLAPGMTYRDGFSPLSAESTDNLEPLLPDRPLFA
ncbi:MAG: hypothetical protein ABI321_07520 [Polyangia bacterium]